jgi:hypothetical protein
VPSTNRMSGWPTQQDRRVPCDNYLGNSPLVTTILASR